MLSIINIFKEKITGLTDKLGISSYILLITFNILYFSTLVGIILINTNYINIFNVIVHSILCLFLMYRFNPLRKNIEIKFYDQIIIFSSAFFLLLNLGIVEVVKKLFTDGSKIISKTHSI